MFKYSFAESMSVIPSCLNSAINLFLNVPFSRSTFDLDVATLVVTKIIPNSLQILPNCVVSILFFPFENEFLLSVLILCGIP